VDTGLRLRAFVDAARAAWPDIHVPEATFAAYVTARSAEGPAPLALAGDWYLACACAAGVPRAVAAFQRVMRPHVARAIVRTDPSPAFLDEVVQTLNVKLFVGACDREPAIREYSGASSLRGWVMTAAKRTALNMRRAKGDQAHAEVTSGLHSLGETSPELALCKARYKAEFETSIRAALASLDGKGRALLLLHLVNGLTLPQLAAMQDVSRATIARWLAAARDALFEATRRELTERLRLPPSEYESMLALVRSQLEVSVVAAMTPAATPRRSVI
jgi:RNA polymerase sigma-70 factor (ECF subfamily)